MTLLMLRRWTCTRHTYKTVDNIDDLIFLDANGTLCENTILYYNQRNDKWLGIIQNDWALGYSMYLHVNA